MGADKHSSKSGYVGGFLQLFDWNAKSRKKLFAGKSDLPEQSKQRKRSDGNLSIAQFKMMDEDDRLAVSSIKGSSDYSCASSVTDEEGYGTKAPSVVARLMGLDSMPTSDLEEPLSTPFFDSQSLRDAHSLRRELELHRDRQITHSGNLRNMETPLQKAMDAKIQKMVNRPIEKFQTEMLPPKSAKSISITHHKLLSPIKSPGFIPSNNAAHIMEAAAKIIEPGPPISSNKTKIPLLGTSSVPIRVKEMREKVEAARKPTADTESSSARRQVESNAAKLLKGQSANKSWNGTVDSALSRVSSNSEDSSSAKNKAKSVSLALQAKVNVQRREGLSSNGDRIIFGQKERNDVLSSQTFKSQPNSQRSAQKKPSSVLRQNNQKQNSLIDKQKLPSKPLPSNGSQGRKAVSGNSSLGRQKTSKSGGNSKVGLRKLGSELPDGKREASCPGSNNVSRKRRITNGSYHSDSNQATDNFFVNKTEQPIESSSILDRHFTWAEDTKRKGMDVVSFTFTAPMTRSLPLSEKVNGSLAEYRGKSVLCDSESSMSVEASSLRRNVIGADALSILLEQKLMDLTYGVEPSRKRIGTAGNSASTFQDLVPAREMLHDKKHGGQDGYIFASIDSPVFMPRHKSQGIFEMDDCSSEDTETRKMFNRRQPSPNSVLEPSFLTESCNSSDTTNCYSLEGSKHSSSVQALEVFGTNSSKRLLLRGADSELSDSASSTFRAASTSWELEYVNQILFNVELMFKDFALGRAREIINPHLFNQLESRKEVFGGNQGEELKMRRKVLFDCVSECMDLRCRRFANGGWSMWAKGSVTLRRKDWLAEEVYKEISGWRAMADCMVDDLVDKDMSSHSGKWLDFEVEAFELGIEIESSILNSLINEVVCHFLIM